MREYIETVINGLKTTWLSMLSKVEELARQAKAAADEAQNTATDAQDAATSVLTTVDAAIKAIGQDPVFTGTFSQNRKSETTIGGYSHSEGNNTTASGFATHAEGNNTIASEDYSHAEGWFTAA